MKKKLSNIVFYLKTRPKMYLLGYDSYSSMVCFLVGFGEAIKDNEQNIFSEFNTWLETKVEKKFSLHWSSYILEEMCFKNEEKAKLELIKLLEEFCGGDSN